MTSLRFRRMGRGTILLVMAAAVVLVVARPQWFGTGDSVPATSGTRGLPRADAGAPRTAATPAADPRGGSGAQASNAQVPAAPPPEVMNAIQGVSARIEANVRDVDAWMELGGLLLSAKDFGRGAEAFAAAIEIAPARAEAHAQLGKALLFEGMVHVARLELQRALALDASLAEAQLNLGITYSHGVPADLDAARAAWTRAVDLAPDSDVARQAGEYLKSYAEGATPAHPSMPGH